MSESSVAWPPSPEQRQHLARLGELIRRFGAERFTRGHLVRADQRDFPDPWQPTAAAVHRLLYRLFWHAYLDPEIVLDDVRPAAVPEDRMLTTSNIELVSAGDGRATFQLVAIGNDDVAGLLSHQIGTAFLELAPADPFRDARGEITPTDGSIAACYLGLGVLVANSTMYRRHASRLVAKQVISEQHIAEVGGLTIEDATFLVAVQNILLDDVQDALETLHGPQAEWVAGWTEVLEPHEDELRATLGIEEQPSVALTRVAAPRVPAPLPERDLTKFNAGHTTFRVPTTFHGRSVIGFVVGLIAFMIGLKISAPDSLNAGLIGGGAVFTACTFVGWRLGRRGFICADMQCRHVMAAELPVCPACGGSIAETIAHANLRLARLEELEGPPPDEPA